MKRNTAIYLKDILESIKNIESFMENVSKDQFYKNIEKQSAVLRQIEIIGEAAKQIPEEFRSKYAQIPWKDIAGMRDIVIHSYFKIDLNKVWELISKDLPILKKQIRNISKN